ncbi:LAMI_0H00584g1_1 [Lachancea mirantina]|uniref:Phosphatidylserine decarboxylase proenzyme 1, mitochondrial n=1 Tax=Lachancea mirantina TaxID=1230905 RepID=A0A1G4KDG9_9SACH|nr:LAMI_0H00584g1_1 [Lachancea mirantina]
MNNRIVSTGSGMMGKMASGRLSGASVVRLKSRTVTLFNSRFHTGKEEWKNRTAVLWDRQFYSQKVHLQNYSKKRLAKWAVLTSVTLIIGSILLGQDDLEKEVEAESEAADNARRQRGPKIRIFNNNWLFFWYSTLPLNAMSRLWGQVNSLTLPMWMRPWGYRFYSTVFGVDLDEMEDPDFTHYKNLSEFFYRTIRPETRPIAPGDDVVVCPSDGKVLQLGVINSHTGEIEQVKGLTYSVREFLGTHAHPAMSRQGSQENLDTRKHDNDSDNEKPVEFARINSIPYTFNDIIGETPGPESSHLQKIQYKDEGDTSLSSNTPSANKVLKLLGQLSTNYLTRLTDSDPKNTQLYFAVIYLAPGDYHHYHSPVNWVCKLRRHFPGELFSVAPYFQRNFPNLFVLNERVALLGHWKYGFFSMTPVGATNVGSIKLNFDKELVTNERRRKRLEPHTCYEATYENTSNALGGVPLVKGEEMGGFMLGSTVVLCFEAPKDFKFQIRIGDKVRMGQLLGQTA